MSKNKKVDLMFLMTEALKVPSITVEEIVDNYVVCATPELRQSLINKLKDMRKVAFGIEEDRVVLHLVVKKKLYDMIERGEKPEVYRDDTPYWRRRLLRENRYVRYYTHVTFHCGYSSKIITFRYGMLHLGYGKVIWGAPADRAVFIIKLGLRCY